MIMQSKKIRETPKLLEEVVELEKELAEKKQQLVRKKEADRHDKELIKEIIKEKVEIPKPSKVKPSTPSPASPKTIIQQAKKLMGEKKERQVKLLTDLALEKGVIHATEVAKKLDDPYILDEFHDTLVDEFYNRLVKEGKLKQI